MGKRKRLFRGYEDLGEPGDYEEEDEKNGSTGKNEKKGGIEKSCHDDIPETLPLFEKLRQPLENRIQGAAGLSRVHHVYIEVGKIFAMTAHGVGEISSFLDVPAHPADCLAERIVVDKLAGNKE